MIETKLHGVKNVILQVTYFLNDPMFNLLFIIILFFIERKRTCGRLKKAVWSKWYFQKKNSKYEILNHLYFGLKFVFWGVLYGVLASVFFLIFSRRPTMVFLVHPHHHKKASCGPGYPYTLWLFHTSQDLNALNRIVIIQKSLKSYEFSS